LGDRAHVEHGLVFGLDGCGMGENEDWIIHSLFSNGVTEAKLR
jgi:hypothetical protein